MLLNIMLGILMVICVALVGVILLQRSEGGALGMSGGGPGAFMTARGTGDLLTRSTQILAAVFFCLCLVMGLVSSHEKNAASLVQKMKNLGPVSAAPVAPASAAPTPVAPTASSSAAPALPFGAPVTSSAPVNLLGVPQQQPLGQAAPRDAARQDCQGDPADASAADHRRRQQRAAESRQSAKNAAEEDAAGRRLVRRARTGDRSATQPDPSAPAASRARGPATVAAVATRRAPLQAVGAVSESGLL